ncbi:g10858 [Coccomyxa viridis]|uniref:G10858 protein n=1 Tax=Coccomyxa viridis TaxID=1274662 RepID=A0ABP1G903_9CHLO
MQPILAFSDGMPDELVRGSHPHDYEEVDHFDPVITDYNGNLIARIPLKTPTGKAVVVSFVCATGARSIYLCAEALHALDSKGVLQHSGEQRVAEILYKKESVFTAVVEQTPTSHKNSNVLGCHALGKLGLHSTESGSFFDA